MALRWEGGTHITGFVHAPKHINASAKNFTGLMHECDWLPTLLGAAGVPVNAALEMQKGLPAMDGINMWPYLATDGITDDRYNGGPRTSVLLNVCNNLKSQC